MMLFNLHFSCVCTYLCYAYR